MKCQNLFPGKKKIRKIFQYVVCGNFTQSAMHLVSRCDIGIYSSVRLFVQTSTFVTSLSLKSISE